MSRKWQTGVQKENIVMIVCAIRPRVNTISTLIVGHFESETVTHEGKGRVKVYDRKNNMLNDFWTCAQAPFTMLI
ncbi:hypothetical protein D9M71_841800 [compost metagenome]